MKGQLHTIPHYWICDQIWKTLSQKFGNLGWSPPPDTVNWNMTRNCFLEFRNTLPGVPKESELLALIWWRCGWVSACPSAELHQWVRHSGESCGAPSAHPSPQDQESLAPYVSAAELPQFTVQLFRTTQNPNSQVTLGGALKIPPCLPCPGA